MMRFPRGSVVNFYKLQPNMPRVYCSVTLKGGVQPIVVVQSLKGAKEARILAWEACEQLGLVKDGIES